MKTVLEMAREVGAHKVCEFDPERSIDLMAFETHELERLVELVRADERAKLAEQPAPAQGWKLVPAQPTDQMRDAGNVIIGDRGALFAAYHAMLAAAPQAQENT